jgi:3-methyladenine DNA glycosylase AlkD
MNADRRLVEAVKRGLRAHADPARAARQQAYMKSAMPYRGLSSAQVRAVARGAIVAHQLPSFDAWRDTILALWRGARFREERYAALALAGHRLYRAHQTLDALPMYDELIVTGAWWDYVDDVAVHRVGPLLRAHPKPMRRTLLAWSRDDDMWRRRTSIICQVAARDATDLDLLYAAIEPNLDHRDFFIRKAIGWALRAYAWTDPLEVAQYVAANHDRLSGLSRREAVKNIRP